MKYIILILALVVNMMANVVKAPILSVDESSNTATMKINRIDVGMSGFIVHTIAKDHTVILKSIVVTSFNENTKIATLKISSYDALRHSALPNGRWDVKAGDIAVLAFGYSRGLLIAPNEEIYHRITRSVANLQWIHPDLFATILSFNGHPTPLREDFTKFSIATSVGLIFFFLDEKLYTVDAKSFKILNTTDAKLKQKDLHLPFYTRVEEIDANWWGEGSSELEVYAPYYFKLLLEANPNNKELKKHSR